MSNIFSRFTCFAISISVIFSHPFSRGVAPRAFVFQNYPILITP